MKTLPETPAAAGARMRRLQTTLRSERKEILMTTRMSIAVRAVWVIITLRTHVTLPLWGIVVKPSRLHL